MANVSDEGRVEQVLADLRLGTIDYEQATEKLFSLIYEELRRRAANLMRGERADHTLQTTALVHEVYLNLVRSKPQNWESRAHFFGVASRAMRQVLVDHARRKLSRKRGGDWTRVTLHDVASISGNRVLEIIALDEALCRLAEKHKRMAFVAELHLFSGMSTQEIATVLGVSARTVQGDMRVAKMWLNRELAGHEPT